MKILEQDEEPEDAALFLGTANIGENCPLVSKATGTPFCFEKVSSEVPSCAQHGVELLWRELGCLCIALKIVCGDIPEEFYNLRDGGKIMGDVCMRFPVPDVLCPAELIFYFRRRNVAAFIDILFNVGQISRCQFFLILIFLSCPE